MQQNEIVPCPLTFTRLGASVCIAGSNALLGAQSAIPRKVLEPPVHSDGPSRVKRR
jgi:hypothetical protein